MPLTYDLQLDTVIEGYDRQTCWVHARCGVIPDGPAVLTTQKLRLSGSDIFYCIHDFRSDDFGRTWTGPTMQFNLDRRLREDGCELCPCDQMPQWHAPSQTLLTTGHDGLCFGKPKPWTYDDGAPLGNYNTQQHWITHSDGLFLVYTRRGAENDHVFRHRAPLFMAQVDPDRLCVIRETERIVVPEWGARLGNFGTVNTPRLDRMADWAKETKDEGFPFVRPS